MAIPERFRHNDGKPMLHVFPGGYTLIYWMHEDTEHDLYGDKAPLYSFCGECVDGFPEYVFHAVESGDAYEESLPCEHCNRELADSIPEEEGQW